MDLVRLSIFVLHPVSNGPRLPLPFTPQEQMTHVSKFNPTIFSMFLRINTTDVLSDLHELQWLGRWNFTNFFFTDSL